MLTFEVYDRDYGELNQRVYIDPAAVAAVVETRDRPAFSGSWDIAVIRLHDGTQYKVLDGARQVAKKIIAAKADVEIEKEES